MQAATLPRYGIFVLDYAPLEGLVLGTILVAIGDGLVIPKMKEFGYVFKGPAGLNAACCCSRIVLFAEPTL